MRRSIVAKKDLKKDYVLTKYDIDSKRPGVGISPDKIDSLIGKKLKRDIECDELIFEEDIE